MDKNGQSSSADPTTNASSYYHLKQLNNLSHKISKPVTAKKPAFDHPRQPPPPPNQPHPRVYNINKNDFRDVVQKLTGSPSRESFSSTPPPPIQPPKPTSSRLQRIRPPPLPQVSNRPPPLLNNPVVHPHQQTTPSVNGGTNPIPPPASVNGFMPRPPGPPSPLLPSPALHVAAESPISAYMRYLQSSISSNSNTPISGFYPASQQPPPTPPQQQQNQPQQQPPFAPPGMLPSPTMQQFQLPTSPSPFGFLNSPKSPYPLLSPSLLLSPYSFPLSPTFPMPNLGWRGGL